MPRLNHRKTRTGCERCKTRKVKCDEGKPRCDACKRHNVPCEYVYGRSANTEGQPQPSSTPPTNGPYYAQSDVNEVLNQDLDRVLELRLMYEWTAHSSKTFSPTWQFWCYQAPLIALDCRYLLDAMFAMAALHASKQPPAQWNPIEGRIIPISNTGYDPSNTHLWRRLQDRSTRQTVVDAINGSADSAHLGTKRSAGMLKTSRMYFDRAIQGYTQAVDNLTVENIEAVYTTSILITFNALFALSESGDDSIVPALDPVFWLRLGRGTYFVIQRWREFAGYAWMAWSGVFYGAPDMSDDDWIFAPEHAKPFEKLLSFAENFEVLTDEDRDAYQKTLCYIGTVYKGIVEGTDSPLATSRRLSSMPSKCPPRFVDLVAAKQPRAMVMLAYLFASLKLIEQSDVGHWFVGIAQHQVPKIYEQLPVGWREPMEWPMAIVRGEITRELNDTQIDNSLSL